jgi:hypothetical protein
MPFTTNIVSHVREESQSTGPSHVPSHASLGAASAIPTQWSSPSSLHQMNTHGSPTSPSYPKGTSGFGTSSLPHRSRAQSELSDPVPPLDHQQVSIDFARQDEKHQDKVQGACDVLYCSLICLSSACIAYNDVCVADLHDAVCEILVEMHEWSTTRPQLESAQASDIFKDQVNALIGAEQKQGMLVLTA